MTMKDMVKRIKNKAKVAATPAEIKADELDDHRLERDMDDLTPGSLTIESIGLISESGVTRYWLLVLCVCARHAEQRRRSTLSTRCPRTRT